MSYRALAHSFRVGKTSVGEIIYVTCKAIWDTFQPIHIHAQANKGISKRSCDRFLQ